jgi:hypothetical protein
LAGVHAAGMFGPMLDAYPGNLFLWLLLGAAIASQAPGELLQPRQASPK